MLKKLDPIARKNISAIFKRELAAYFYSPLAYVFVSIFILAIAATSIFIGRIFETNDASLIVVFNLMPWVLLFLVPAIGMQLWSEEYSSGSVELLFTLPITVLQAVLAKFLAAWCFLIFSIAMTVGFPITIFFLGAPDLGQMLSGYLGSILIAGAYLAVSSFTSAMTRKQVISFVFSFIICFLLAIIGWGVFSGLLNQFLLAEVTDFIASFGVIYQFENMVLGIIDLKNILYYFFLMAGGIFLTVRILIARQSK